MVSYEATTIALVTYFLAAADASPFGMLLAFGPVGVCRVVRCARSISVAAPETLAVAHDRQRGVRAVRLRAIRIADVAVRVRPIVASRELQHRRFPSAC